MECCGRASQDLEATRRHIAEMKIANDAVGTEPEEQTFTVYMRPPKWTLNEGK